MKNNLDPHYIALRSFPQTLTNAWLDLGDYVYCGDTQNLTMFIDIEKNDSDFIQLKMVGILGPTDTREYEMPIKILGANKCIINPQFYEFTVTTESLYVLDFDVKALTHCRFKVKAPTPGATPGRILTSYLLKV